jgi:hypothetical protein
LWHNAGRRQREHTGIAGVLGTACANKVILQADAPSAKIPCYENKSLRAVLVDDRRSHAANDRLAESRRGDRGGEQRDDEDEQECGAVLPDPSELASRDSEEAWRRGPTHRSLPFHSM